MEQQPAKTILKETAQRPFMGLRSYEEVNKEQFGGRNAEIKELYTLVETNRLTIVFGKSGIGKTSLIKAGLIPQLQNNYFFPIYIRIDYFSAKTPLSQARELIFKKLKDRDPAVPELGSSTLWEYFRNLTLMDDLLTPLLIFDQFEEIFTIGKNKIKEVHDFIIELSDLAENRVPVLVQEEWKRKAEIVSSFGGKPNFHMVISLREDYLANLESLKVYLPSMKNSRFRVLHMTALQAMDAVMKPAGKLIEKHVAAQIIKKLPGITDLDFEEEASGEDNLKRYVIEPFLLSLICYEINEKRIEKGLDKITQELVEQFDISDVINSYYTKTMQGFGDNVQQGIEDSLLTEGGFRKLQEVGELKNEHNITADDIMQLIEKRILRKEMRDGVEYVELIHDVLMPVIKAKRNIRIAALKEKEKADEIQSAIKLDRNRRRRIIRTALLMVASVISVLLILAISERKQNIETRNRAYARNLLLSAKILSNAYADDSSAAQICRTAYFINKENGGENEIEFYTSMYNSFSAVKYPTEYFKVASIDSFAIRDIVIGSSGTIYFGATNGKVYRKKSTENASEIIYDMGDGNRIMSLAISADKKYLAVAGNFTDVFVFDLSQSGFKPIIYPTHDSTGTSRTLYFNDIGKLILRTTSKIIGWDIKSGQRILWNNIHEYILKARRLQVSSSNIQPANPENFEYRNVGNFNSLTLMNKKIAIGSDSAIIIIANDSVYEVNSKRFDKVTAIEFDPTASYLYIGNTLGYLYRLNLESRKIDSTHFQTARITDISFSTDGKYMASSSFDRTIAIWEIREEWNSRDPLVLYPMGSDFDENIWCVTFSEHNDYVLSGYWSGRILKWPVNSEILADLICVNVSNALNPDILGRIINPGFIEKEYKDHKCPDNSFKSSEQK